MIELFNSKNEVAKSSSNYLMKLGDFARNKIIMA